MEYERSGLRGYVSKLAYGVLFTGVVLMSGCASTKGMSERNVGEPSKVENLVRDAAGFVVENGHTLTADVLFGL
jgi:hypothetical protein